MRAVPLVVLMVLIVTFKFIVDVTSDTLAKNRQNAFSRAAVLFSLMHY